MKLSNNARYILLIFFISFISFMTINLVMKNNNNNIVKEKATKVIIEAPKKLNIPDIKEAEEDGGIRVEDTSPENNTDLSVQPLPIPSLDFPVEVIPLSLTIMKSLIEE